MLFTYPCFEIFRLVATNYALSKPHTCGLQLCSIVLLKRRKDNAVFGHHVGRAYALVHLAIRKQRVSAVCRNVLLALFTQKPRFCGRI